MKRKEIKDFFKSIRHFDIDNVKSLVESNHEYLSVRNFAPPKKDDGQSGLQVSFKIGDFEIAKYLIDSGANVNFIETSEINEWTAPVLHDCIRATIFQSNTLRKENERFEKALEILNLMLSKGANPNSIDSYGNNCLTRALLDSNQMINHPNFDENAQTLNQLRRVFKLLIDYGADVHYSNNQRESATEMITKFELEKFNLI